MSHTTPIYALPYPDEADTADVPRDIQALAQRIEAVLPNVGMPSGMGADWYSANAPPAPFLLCDGSAISRTAYPTLFAAIGTTWGGGDGINTFNLPDTRARVLVGLNPAGPQHAALNGNDGAPASGRRVQHGHTNSVTAGHTLTLPPHAHAVNDPGHYHNLNSFDSGPAGPPIVNSSQTPSGADRCGIYGSMAGPIVGNTTGLTVGNPTSAPAINGGIQIGGGIGVSGTVDAPSFVVVAKVIRT